MVTLPRRQHPPHIARGLDQQGRQPDPAEACTDLGAQPDDLDCARGILRALHWALAIWLVGIAAAVAVLWPVGAP